MIFLVIAGIFFILISILDLMFDILDKYDNFCEKHSNRPTVLSIIVDFLFPHFGISEYGTRRGRFVSKKTEDWILFIIGLIFLSVSVFL